MHAVSREPINTQRRNTECLVLNGAPLTPALALTSLREGKRSVPESKPLSFLGIQREPAWEGNSVHGKEGAVAWGREGPLFLNLCPGQEGKAAISLSFPVSF